MFRAVEKASPELMELMEKGEITASILGIEPTYNEYDGSDPLGYVIGMNLNRRHLNETQRGVVASKLANMTKADAGNLGNISQGNASANLHLRYEDTYEKKVSVGEAATMLNVSPRTIKTVKAVEKASPELMELMEKGEITASILGIEPTYNEYDGSDPLGYVIGMNLNRRHLNETQRGTVIVPCLV